MFLWIGIFHLMHSPFLILFPFIVNTFDLFYIIYFFSIMLSYTFLNGECPISYTCKRMMDTQYMAGTNVKYYPEMEYLLNKKTIDYYFGITTFLYIISLVFVLYRSNMFSYMIVFVLLFYYVLLVNYSIKTQMHFRVVQEITKYTLGLTLLFLVKQAAL
jgi:hypothetical protein